MKWPTTPGKEQKRQKKEKEEEQETKRNVSIPATPTLLTSKSACATTERVSAHTTRPVNFESPDSSPAPRAFPAAPTRRQLFPAASREAIHLPRNATPIDNRQHYWIGNRAGGGERGQRGRAGENGGRRGGCCKLSKFGKLTTWQRNGCCCRHRRRRRRVEPDEDALGERATRAVLVNAMRRHRRRRAAESRPGSSQEQAHNGPSTERRRPAPVSHLYGS